ncbi:dihydrofolate reductase family protein [Streptomyces cinereoruber]|uniref:dihydrofolate reductase family protein n=1 Tax=Streptomyces cinereoruber TaxID=67260 RepID=UPI003C2C6A3A
MSLDGHLDTRPGEERLLLSSKRDFDRVDSVHADVDTLLVGAGTLRTDNPCLLVNSAERRTARIAADWPEYPLKVTVTGNGGLDPDGKLWHHDGDELVVAVGEAAARRARVNLGDLPPLQRLPTTTVWPTALGILGDLYAV